MTTKYLAQKQIKLLEQHINVDNVDKIQFFVENFVEIEESLTAFIKMHPSYLALYTMVNDYMDHLAQYYNGDLDLLEAINKCESLVKLLSKSPQSEEKHSLYVALRMDMTSRILAHKYNLVDVSELEPCLSRIFIKAINRVSDVCTKRATQRRFKRIETLAYLKRGVFTNNAADIEMGLSQLSDYFTPEEVGRIKEEVAFYELNMPVSYDLKALNILIGGNLRRLRQNKNISIKVLAEFLGASQSTVSYIEQGERALSIDNALKLAQLLDVPLEMLVGGAIDKKEIDEEVAKKQALWASYQEQLTQDEVELLLNRGEALMKYKGRIK